MISETEFYCDIFEEFIDLDNFYQENELWKSNSIIKLMQISNRDDNKNVIEKGLKIILKLCKFKECGKLLDSYEIESFDIRDLIETEKQAFDSILVAEFT